MRMQQADERNGRNGQQETESPMHTAELRAERKLRLAPGRARWLETVANPRSTDTRSTDKTDVTLSPGIGTGRQSDTFASLLHDARNMVSAIDLYCDLLEESGVLNAPFRHYAGELRIVGGASRRLLEKLSAVEGAMELQLSSSRRNGPQPVPSPDRSFDRNADPRIELLQASGGLSRRRTDRQPALVLGPITAPVSTPISTSQPESLSRGRRRQVFQGGQSIESLAEEVQASHNLLSALVGPAIKVGLSISGCRRPIAMTGDDLVRILVNLTRNAADAMPGGGHIQIALEEGEEYLSLSFTDNGPGIPQAALETVFTPGYSTRVGLDPASDPTSDLASDPDFDLAPKPVSGSGAWPVQRRGLGLSIVRSIVSAAGGSVWAANRIGNPYPNASEPDEGSSPEVAETVANDKPARLGAIILIEFPLRTSSIVP
jgi:signal transduction histidine kinase